MKNYFCCIVLFLILVTPYSYAKTITGGIELSVNQAREEMFSDSFPNPNISIIRANVIDINRRENVLALLNGILELKDRTLAKFSDGSYGVIYKNDPKNVFYYSNDGFLIHNEVKTSLEYPYKTFKYRVDGELVNTSLRVSMDESFVFTPDGKLLAHWIGGECFDDENNLIMTRKIFE